MHQVRGWITRPDDPTFWERAADICGLYLVPPAPATSVDEKTEYAAHGQTRPTTGPAIRPPGSPRARSTSTPWHRDLLAALDVHGGGVFTATDLDRNTAQNFISFLDDLDAKVPAGLQVHLVLDNGSSGTRDTRWWFVDHPRFHPTTPRPLPRG